jgi:polysaccharide biosynthesis/export protein
MAGRESFALQDGDGIYIRKIVDNGRNIEMTLAGQFNFPGKYMVSSGEKLSSVIRRGGGFTDNAYLRGAVFIRQSVKERQLITITEISRRLEDQSQNLLAQTTSEKDRETILAAVSQRKSLLEDVKSAPYLGRVVLNLDRDLSFTDKEEDLTLEMGDSLFVGAYPNIISIMGEVYSPTNVVFGKDNNTVGECLDKAGGVGEYGDAGNVYYLRPDGSVLTPKNTSFFRWRAVEAGGSIVVPPKGPKKDYLDALAKITQIIYQTAISVGVVKTLFL